MATAIDASRPVSVDSLPGGRYAWVDNLDGTYNILDVPILAELPAGTFPHPVNKDPVDRAWMERAIAKAKQREDEGHVGSVHVHHHGAGAEVVEAGRLLLDHVGRLTYDGQERDALFAHILRIPKATFDEIRAGKLPYRSIEGEPWDKCEVVSLAIMPTETPYFRLPMLTLGSEVRQSCLSLALDKRYAVAASASGFSTKPAVGGQPMPAEEKVVAEAPKPLPAQQANPAPVAGTQPEQPAKAQQDQKPEDGKPPEKKSGGVGNKMKELFAMMMALVMSAIGEDEEKQNPADQRKADKAPAEQEANPQAKAPEAVAAAAPVAAPAPEKPAEPVKAELTVESKPALPKELGEGLCKECAPKVEAWYRGCGSKAEAPVAVAAEATAPPAEVLALKTQNAELTAKVAALEVKAQAQVVVDEVAKDLADAEKALTGYNLTTAIKAAMAEQRKTGGKACLDAFVRVFAQAALKDPPASLEAATQPSSSAAGAAPSGGDEILNKLGPQPPETMKRAHELIAQAKQYCAAVRDTSPEDYVRYALKAEGLLRA
jgi:hypothetical protein